MDEQFGPSPGDQVYRPSRVVWPRWRSGVLLLVMVVVAGKLCLPRGFFTGGEYPSLPPELSWSLQVELNSIVQRAVADTDYTLEEYGRDYWRVMDLWGFYDRRYQVDLTLLRATVNGLDNWALTSLINRRTSSGNHFSELEAAKRNAAPTRVEEPIDKAGIVRGMSKLYLIGLVIALPLLLLRPFEAARSWREGWGMLRLTWFEATLSALLYPIAFNSYWPDQPMVFELVDALAQQRGSQARCLTYCPSHYRSRWCSERLRLPTCPIWRQAYDEIMPSIVFRWRWLDLRARMAVARARLTAVVALWQRLITGQQRSTNSRQSPLEEEQTFTQWVMWQHQRIGRSCVVTALVLPVLPLFLLLLLTGRPAYGDEAEKAKVLTGLYAELIDNPVDKQPPNVILNAGFRIRGRIQNLYLYGATGKNPVLEIDADLYNWVSGDFRTSLGPYLGYGLGHRHVEGGGLCGFGVWRMADGSSIAVPWYAGYDRHSGLKMTLPHTRWLYPVSPTVALGLGTSLTMSDHNKSSCLVGPVGQFKLDHDWTLRVRVAFDPNRPSTKNELRIEAFTRF